MSKKRGHIEEPAKKKSSGEYEIGKGKPPKAHQFKPGHSGNPNGRPKGSRNFITDVKAMLGTPVRLLRDGRTKTISTQEASLMRLREKALSSDARALEKILTLAASVNSEQLDATPAATSADDVAALDIFARRVLSGAFKLNTPPQEQTNPSDAAVIGEELRKEDEQ